MEKTTTLNRRAKILDRLESSGQVEVPNLSELFKVSEVTIRNDLAHLEKKNLLLRTRGGAIKQRRVGLDFALAEKQKQHLQEKQHIGRAAAEMIQEHDTVILDSGSTTMEIARNLGHLNQVTVITNALNIAGILAEYKNIKVIIPGGFLRENSYSLIGSMAEQSVRNYYCDKLFLGVDGFDSRYGISTPNIEEAQLNRVMVEISRELIVVTDSSKFNRRSFAFIAPSSQIDFVVTDKGIPLEEQNNLKTMGVKVIIA
jgi:DeoR family transcriptional regulator, aga operon transcriptional repressor